MPTDTQAEGEGGSVTLRSFLAGLATDRTKLGAYIADPDAAMTEAGLGPEQQELLKSGNLGLIYARFVAEQEGGAQAPAMVVVVDGEQLQDAYARGLFPQSQLVGAAVYQQAPPQFYPPPPISTPIEALWGNAWGVAP